MTETDLAAELAGAQRRLRRRMLWMLGGAAALVALGVGAIAFCNRAGPEVPDIARPYLWRVDGPTGPSYLFGTVHIGYATGDLPRVVLAAQESAQTTIVESDLLSKRAERRVPAEEGRLRLEADVWRQLADMTGVAEDELVTWDSSRLVGASVLALAPRAEPMDRGLQARAGKLGKPILFLDDRSLDQVMNEQSILTGLTMAIRHRTQFRAELMAIVRGYSTGEEARCASGGLGGLVEGLNETWQATIEEQIKRGTVFVAVGCAHLVGPDSVTAHLRARGYQIRRVE